MRHGQSTGNVARDAAEAEKQSLIAIAERDVDVPLSGLGARQAQALGDWFATLPLEQQPTFVLYSPYVRAQQTAQAMLERIDAGSLASVVADERLREKEFGIFDRLTAHGIASKYPELHEQRQHVGKFYVRPPGGESWCDVILHLRSVLDTVTREYRGRTGATRSSSVACATCWNAATSRPSCPSTRRPTCPTAASPRTLSTPPWAGTASCSWTCATSSPRWKQPPPRHGPARYACRAEILMLRGHAWTLSTSHIPYITPPLRRSWRHKNNSISISRKNR
ncbi:histidine phosphatase family protein [Janthinobacterium sp. MDT1-19]|uniref:histidine phosphatase family protein n=1 Tax=Janthinobacterium sp. MDT1-19 TaxID=1259339 RepID=UPI003F27C8D2